MHRSRIGVVLIDHPSSTYDRASAFWGGVAGLRPRPAEGPYETLGTLGGVELALQRTGDGTPARVHLDVESDDVAAEVERLVRLGATVTERHDEYAILADPGGLVFCVVPVQSEAEFERSSTTWP